MREPTKFIQNLIDTLLKWSRQHINGFLNSDLVPKIIVCFEAYISNNQVNYKDNGTSILNL